MAAQNGLTRIRSPSSEGDVFEGNGAASLSTAAAVSAADRVQDEELYARSTVSLWKEVYQMLCVKLQDRVDAQQVATFTFEENIITSRDYSQIQTIKHTASREAQAEFLLGILSHGDNTTFDIFLSILYNKMKTQVYQGLAREMNDAANSLIPVRSRVFQLEEASAKRHTKEKTCDDIKEPQDASSPAMVVYKFRAELCDFELDVILADYNFGSQASNSLAKDIMDDDSLTGKEKRIMIVQALIDVGNCDVESITRLLERKKHPKLSKHAEIAKRMKDHYSEFRRKNLPKWKVIPMFYANDEPKMTLCYASNGQPYLMETPAIECSSQSRVILEDYLSVCNAARQESADAGEGSVAANGVNTATASTANGSHLNGRKPSRLSTSQQQSQHGNGNTAGAVSRRHSSQLASEVSDSSSPSLIRSGDINSSRIPDREPSLVDQDIGHVFKVTSWHRQYSVNVETVALIGSSDSTESYCREHLPSLKREQFDEIWQTIHYTSGGTKAGGMVLGRSSVHLILYNLDNRTCRCIFVVRLGPSDSKSTQLRLLRKVILGCQSVNILYGPREVEKLGWLAKSSLHFGTTTMMISDGCVYNDSHLDECQIQEEILDTLRRVFYLYPHCPMYRCVSEPGLHLWFSVLHFNKLKDSKQRLNPVCDKFRIQRSSATQSEHYDLVADKDYRAEQQLPLVSVKSGNSSKTHPHTLCRPVQSPVELWLQDVTVECPITLLAATDSSVPISGSMDCKSKAYACAEADAMTVPVCTAFPACNDQIEEQMSPDMSSTFWRIEAINQLSSLNTWNFPVRVITCISETQHEAFNCLNYIAGGSFPVAEDIILSATDAKLNVYPVSRLMACTRFAEGRLYVMLALPGITTGTFLSRAGVQEGQRNLLLSAMALSHVFVLDAAKEPKKTILGFSRAITQLLPQLPRKGLHPDREFVDISLYSGHLTILSSSTSKVGRDCFESNIKVDGMVKKCVEVIHPIFPLGTSCIQYKAQSRKVPSPTECSAIKVEKGDPMRSEPLGYAQGRAVFGLLMSLHDMPCYAKGSLFVTTLNLVLSLASTSFMQAVPVKDLYRFQIRKLEQKLFELLRNGDCGHNNVNGQRDGNGQLIQHMYRQERKEFFLSDTTLGEDEATTVTLIRAIKDSLMSQFGHGSTIGTILNIITHVQKCIRKLVDHRCEDAIRFLNGELETGDYIHVEKGDFQKIIESFRKKWVLCGIKDVKKRCSKCYYRCLLIDGHDSPCDCLNPNDEHLCGTPCKQQAWDNDNSKWYECVKPCVEKAAHVEGDSSQYGTQHKCEPIDALSVHKCRNDCHLAESPSCVQPKRCVRFVSHSKNEDCLCDKQQDDHLCPKICDLVANPIWLASGSIVPHLTVDMLSEESVPVPSATTCHKPMLPHHHEHLCGSDHKCMAQCDKSDGICTTIRKGNEVPDGAESVSGQDGYRLLCHERITSDQTVHDPGHSCGKSHRCAIKCPLCDCHCTKEYGHDGLHTMEEHGLAINSSHLLVLEGEELKPISDSTSFTCHDICLKAGRGHVHLTPNSRISHRSTGSEMRENHDEFWARFGFSKPCSDPQFMKCAAKCHNDSHNDEHAVFCSGDVLHPPITDVLPADGYVSLERDANSGTLPGHHFKCEPSSHRCYNTCTQKSYGKRCSRQCEKNLSHTGDDCNCGKFHSCGNACPVSKSSRDMVYKCSNVCEKSSEEKHPDCFCEDNICHVTCNIQGCMKPCGLHHTHDGNEHDCKGDHMCIGLCEESGRCSTDTHVGDSDEHSQPRTEASSHLNTSTSCASKEKTSCGITLKNPLRSHSGPHKCSGKHFCRDQCKSCSQYCNLEPNHSGQRHETQHGRILDERHLLVFKADRTPMRIQDSTTCSSLCSDAGSGHVHVLSTCSSRYDCRSSTDEIIRHVTIPGRNNRQHVHVTTHVNFWIERNFQDPYEEKLIQGVFQRCPEIFQTSLQPGATFQCEGNVWHVSFDKQPTGSLHSARDLWTFASQKVVYHYFEGCRQDCTEFCSILDYGAKCTARCVEEAGHKCSKFCKRECRGQGDPIYKHIAGQVVHTCGKKHHCKEMCQNQVGVCFRKTVNGEDLPPHSTRFGDGNAYKLPCSEAIPVGYSDHGHVVNHHRCVNQHTCEKFCRLCGQYCSLLPNHPGLCKTDHGVVIKSQLESLKVWTVDDTAVSWEDCDGMTCAELCNRAGPSHSHETKCKCSWRTGEAKFHRHRSSALLASSIDDISHNFFWNNELGFEDPTPDEKQRIAFSRCRARCNNPKEEHEDTDEDKLYCTEGLFHPKLIPNDYRDKPGYCSPCEPYHHFACKQHRCSSSCMLYDNGKRCTDRCKLNANHCASGLDCVCEKVKHICGVECQNRFCRMLCQEDWSPNDNHTHWCHSNDNCSGTCEFENCKRECDLGHLHGGKCNCRKAHRCPGKCQKDGLCSITFSTESGLELPRETHGDCEVAILPGRDSHSGECDCKKKHTCLKQCALCKQFCTLGHHHYKQKHQTKHSLIVNVRDWTMLGADESAVSVPDDVTCSELCTTADIGHTHILDHDSLHLVCSNDRRKCRPLNEKTSHHATHVHFWASLGFADPSEESLKEKFRRCNVVCDRHSPSNSSPVYCTGEQWHDLYRGETVTRFTTGYVGNIQDTPSFGHHFKCSNHLCEEPCDLVHPGGVGEGSDHKCGLPLGHDCTDSCKLSCKGHRSAGHCSGSSTHCCDTAHKCQEMCEGSDGHCKPVAEAGYTGTLRLACAKEIPALKWRHGGIHHHKRDVFSRPANDGEHFCTVTCPRCHMTCQKRFNHDGNHRTTHGAVINRSATEINMALVDPWKTVSPCREDFSFQTASATCSAMCQLAGPGHLHVFGEVGIEESHQLQEMSHVEFWKKVKFDDPYDNEDAAQFNKCSKPCTYLGHGQERILCERELFHGVLFMGEVPVDNHLSEDGCLLKCQHPCENGCAFQDLSRSCVGKCKLGYGHSGEDFCEAPRHICKSTCSECESGCVAVLDNPSTPHDVHKCDEHKPCGEQCGFVYGGQKGILCTKRCTRPSRHVLDPVLWKHSCQSKHRCAEFCNHEGRCPPDGFAGVASGQQLQNAEGFAATAGQQQLNAEGRRMCCDTAFHGTNHDCGYSHLCSTQCPQCGVFCSLVYHRNGEHSIAHGTVAAGTRVNVVNSQGSVHIQRDIACHKVCELAGRSHYHVVKCPHDCTGNAYYKAEVEWHWRDRREKHHVTHREFWKRQEINDPCFQVTTQKTLEEFGLCIHLCHQSCFGSKCSLPAMHNVEAAPDDVHKLKNHYYPRCRQLCKGYCRAHSARCTRPAGHDTDHACQSDARSVSSGGATSSVSRLQGPKCKEKCPICSVECSLPSPHDSPHDCIHGYVPDGVCRSTICQMSKPFSFNVKGQTCSTMCVDKKDSHCHVFQRQTGSAQRLPSGIEYKSKLGQYVCSHNRFWQVYNFKNPSQL